MKMSCEVLMILIHLFENYFHELLTKITYQKWTLIHNI